MYSIKLHNKKNTLAFIFENIVYTYLNSEHLNLLMNASRTTHYVQRKYMNHFIQLFNINKFPAANIVLSSNVLYLH